MFSILLNGIFVHDHLIYNLWISLASQCAYCVQNIGIAPPWFSHLCCGISIVVFRSLFLEESAISFISGFSQLVLPLQVGQSTGTRAQL